MVTEIEKVSRRGEFIIIDFTIFLGKLKILDGYGSHSVNSGFHKRTGIRHSSNLHNFYITLLYKYKCKRLGRPK